MSVHQVINPATEKVVTEVASVDAAGTDEAVARARAAFPAWRAVAPGDRARLLRRFAEAVDGDREHLAQLEVENSGHTIGNARWEAGNARDVIGYYAESSLLTATEWGQPRSRRRAGGRWRPPSHRRRGRPP